MKLCLNALAGKNPYLLGFMTPPQMQQCYEFSFKFCYHMDIWCKELLVILMLMCVLAIR